tara:strand:+ start:159 stop:1133 length:975 start_codon:yes stop_codon:yes gene_type:complete
MNYQFSKLIKQLRIPVIGSPMFIVSTPRLVVDQCTYGIVGSFPALNARGKNGESTLDQWLHAIRSQLATNHSLHSSKPAPYAVNQIVHPTNRRLWQDMETIIKHKVPIVITSLGANKEINDAVHSYNGIVLHDVTTNTFAKKAVEKGVDGLIAVAAGAGGHAGSQSPFALVEEIRQWYNGPLVLGGSISSGRGIAAALKMGADMAYIGSPFIATNAANSSVNYKQMCIDCSAEDIVNTDYFTGINGNYLGPSITQSGIDIHSLNKKTGKPDNLLDSNKSVKAWTNIWGAGQGIGNTKEILSARELILKWKQEFDATTSGDFHKI